MKKPSPALALSILAILIALFGQPIATTASELFAKVESRSAAPAAFSVYDHDATGDLLRLVPGTTATPASLRVLSNGSIIIKNGSVIASATP